MWTVATKKKHKESWNVIIEVFCASIAYITSTTDVSYIVCVIIFFPEKKVASWSWKKNYVKKSSEKKWQNWHYEPFLWCYLLFLLIFRAFTIGTNTNTLFTTHTTFLLCQVIKNAWKIELPPFFWRSQYFELFKNLFFDDYIWKFVNEL